METIAVNIPSKENVLSAKNVTVLSFSNECFTEEKETSTAVSGPSTSAKDSGKLRKSFSTMNLFIIGVSSIMGSGIYVIPSIVAENTTDMGWAILVWIVCGLVALLAALTFCELSTSIKKTGGSYVYILETYGKVAGFVACWSTIFFSVPVSHAFRTLAIGKYLVEPFFQSDEEQELAARLVAVLCVVLIAIANCLNISFYKKLQTFFMIEQVVGVTFLIALGAWQVIEGKTDNFKQFFTTTPSLTLKTFGEFGIAMYSCLVNFEGWRVVSIMNEESNKIEKTMVKATMSVLPFVTTIFVTVNLSFITVLSRDEIADSSVVGFNFVYQILGIKLAWFVQVLVSLASFGTGLSNVFAMSRLLLSAAREGQLPKIFAYIHESKRTPITACLGLSTLTLAFLFIPGNNLRSLAYMFGLSVWFTHTACFVAVPVLRICRPDLKRSFKIPILIPVILVLISLLLLVFAMIGQPVSTGIYLGFVLLGVPMYYIFIHRPERFPARLFDKPHSMLCEWIKKHSLVLCRYDNEGT